MLLRELLQASACVRACLLAGSLACLYGAFVESVVFARMLACLACLSFCFRSISKKGMQMLISLVGGLCDGMMCI